MKKLLYLLVLSLYFGNFLVAQTYIGGATYIVSSGNKLMIFNPDACSYNSVGSLFADPFLRATDIAFTPNGKLYGIAKQSLVEIDTATGNATEICTYDPDQLTWFASLVALNDSILLSDAYDTLWRINIHDCSINRIGKIGYDPLIGLTSEGLHLPPVEIKSSDGDMTWLGRYLYTISSGRLYRIYLNSEATAILSSVLISSPLLELPPSFGLTTTSRDFDGTELGSEQLLSFSEHGGEVVMIDPTTGEFETYCYNSPQTAWPWGASVQPRTYIDTVVPPIDTTGTDTIPETDTSDVEPPTSINNFEEEGNLKIYPNPVLSNSFTVQTDAIILKESRIRLLDLKGSEVPISLQRIAQNKLLVTLSSLSGSGIFILEVVTDNLMIRKKVVLSSSD